MRNDSSGAIAVVGGTGDAGYGLALRWAKAGHQIIIGSRDAGRAEKAAAEVATAAGSSAVRGLVNQEAVAAAGIVVLSVPFSAQAPTIKDILDSFQPGTLVISITVPLAIAVGGKVTHTLGVWEGSASQQVAALVGQRATVVGAFHNVAADTLRLLDQALDEDIIVCGPKDAKERVRPLVEAIPNLRYVDGGPLENARYTESMTALLAGINGRYKVRGAGIRITGLPD